MTDPQQLKSREWPKHLTQSCDGISWSRRAHWLWIILMSVGGVFLVIWFYDTLDRPIWFRRYIRYRSARFSLENGNKELYVYSYLPNSTGLKSKFTSRKRIVSKDSLSPNVTCSGLFQGTPFEELFSCSKISPSTNNIFFLETSCAVNQKLRLPGHLTLTAKQACSVYSAAYHHPLRNVILLLTCPLASQFYTWTKPYQRALLEHPNVFFGYVDLEELYANTSLLEFYRQDLVYSEFPTAHNSDLLRLYLLFVYGGTYLDLDAICLRSLDDLGVNFIGQEDKKSVANGIMNFEPNHEFLRKCLLRGLMTYNATKWNSLGPEVITTSLLLFCNVAATGHLKRSEVCNITILPPRTFYAVPDSKYAQFYSASMWKRIRNTVNGSYVAHYWNHEGSFPLMIGSDQPIIKLAQDHCTNIYKTLTLVME